jgi:hypothetical protein
MNIPNGSNNICTECDKKKDLPLDTVNSSSNGMPCEKPYFQVAQCMKLKKGLVSECTIEWDTFKQCHEENKSKKY